MRRVVALGLSAAALCVPLAPSASAEMCRDVTSQVAVCVTYQCRDRYCINRDYTGVYTTCDHPMPGVLCVHVPLPH